MWHVWRVNHPTRILTDSTVNGAITELDPDNAPIITSFEEADGSAQDDTNNDSDFSEGNVEDAVTIDDPDTIENVTLDAFSE